MIKELVSGYRKAEMGMINSLSGSGVSDEVRFYDVGYMQTQISHIRKEMKRISDEVRIGIETSDNSDYGKQHRAELMEQRERLLFEMVFLASNSFSNLDDCVRMADGHDFKFMQAVEGLREYHSGSNDRAFCLLEQYYREQGSVEGHFLLNKVFGLLLAGKGMYAKAVPFLTYALQFMPDDTECLTELKACYEKQGQPDRAGIVGEVLSVLN